MKDDNDDATLKSLTLPEIWQRLLAAVEKEAPWVVETLRPPATGAALDEFEAVLGKLLPADFRTLYGLNDGHRPMPDPPMMARDFLQGMEFRTLKSIREHWQEYHEFSLPGPREAKYEIDCLVVGPLKPRMRLRNLLYFCRRELRNMYVDLDPAPGGEYGQMVLFQADEVRGIVVAPSLRDWLLKLMIQWEHGAYAYDKETGITTIDWVIDEMEYRGITDENRERYQTLKARHESLSKRIGRI